MKKPTATVLAVVLAACSLVLQAASFPLPAGAPAAARRQTAPKPPEVKLPDTPAGRVAGEFLAAVNTGTEKDFVDFFARHGSEAALKRHTDEERLQMCRQMKDRMGRLAVRSVHASGDVGIILVAETEKAGWVRLDFSLEAKPPHKLDAVRIEDTDAAPGAPAPPQGQQPPPPPPPPAPPSDEKFRAFADEFLTRAQAFGFTGGVLVSRHGKVVLERSCGLADRAGNVPITASTAFDIGSNTKDFTKMAVLQLADAGKLRLDDPIAKYLDGVPPDKSAITVAMLMGHTAGFPMYSGPDEEAVTRADFLKRILAAPLIAEPGRDENYSNPGYSLLAAIIEKVTGGSWEEYVAANILKPAGMTETGYALPKWKPGRIAHAYRAGRDTGSTFDYPHAPDGPYWNLRGNGGTLSTLGDMYKFHLALAGDKLLKKESKERLFPQAEPVVLVGGNGVHFFCYHREPSAGLAILVASTDESATAMDMDRALAAIALGRPVALPPEVVAPVALDRFAGTYALPSGAKFIVASLKDRLAIFADGQDATGLLAGLGPESAAEAGRLNAAAAALAEATARGDSGPLAAAFGGRVKPAEIKARVEKMRQERESRLGAFKGVRVLGSVPAPPPAGPRRRVEPGESVSVVALEYERGTAYTRFVWVGEGLVGRDPDLPALPATEFRPVSASRFASYNLAAGSGTELGFELDDAGRVTGLSFGTDAMRTIAKRVG